MLVAAICSLGDRKPASAQDVLAQDTLNVMLNKSTVLKLDREVKTVVIGKSEIADVSMESRNLMVISGKSVGETNLYVLDGNGEEIVRYNVVVAPEDDRHVTVNRSTDALWTYSCNPRCVVIKNPTDVVGTAFVPPPSAAPVQPAAAPAPAVAPGTTTGVPASTGVTGTQTAPAQ